ncbi:tight adherence protein C [Natronobacillus azotifigens]|uniref:Type II secretion system F family protein n=1 Tax=Natronobacillus azotifigens TaxID=472978 RepID=A0A9J6RC77_9BACI|nr:type II secretion system F family protein [Natronobacillus azotifigens]MCZ0703133.1 type II secretion system F family protein [Natronobacillus azotifigens]
MVPIISVGIIVILLLIRLLAGKKYNDFLKPFDGTFQFAFIAPASLYIIDALQIMKRFSNKLSSVQRKVAIVYHVETSVQGYTKMFIAEMISTIYAIFIVMAILNLARPEDFRFIIFGLIVAIIIPLIWFRKLDDRVERRRLSIIYELPEFSNKVALLVNAGETVTKAIVDCARMKENEDHPLYEELNDMALKIQNGDSFNKAMEIFSKRCGIQEVSSFTTTILLNYRRGGEHLSLALREISRELWEKRKIIAKTRGEEASSKLVFPMVLTFAAILIVIAYPALRMF